MQLTVVQRFTLTKCRLLFFFLFSEGERNVGDIYCHTTSSVKKHLKEVHCMYYVRICLK